MCSTSPPRGQEAKQVVTVVGGISDIVSCSGVVAVFCSVLYFSVW